jgi:hypothetical protein
MTGYDDGKSPKVSIAPRPGEKFTSVAVSTTSLTNDFKVILALGPAVKAPEKPADDHQIYSLVGRVASEWSHVERRLDVIIWNLAGVDHEKGACITAQMLGAYNRCKAIIALLKLLQQKTGKDLSKLINLATDLSNTQNGPNEKRNRIVHDPWLSRQTDTATVAQFKAMAHKDWKYGVYPVDLVTVEDALVSIGQFDERVKKFQGDIFALLKSSR